MVAGLTWVYARWVTDEKKTELNPRIGHLGFGHLLRYLNYGVARPDGGHRKMHEIASDGRGVWRIYNPQARFVRDAEKYPTAPRLGTGIYLCLINLLVLAIASHFFLVMLVGLKPYISGGGWMSFLAYAILVYATTIASWSAIFASSAISVPLSCSKACHGGPNQHNYQYKSTVIHRLFLLASLFALAISVPLILRLDPAPKWMLDFERITNLPSGVSPLFPVLFMAGSLAAWIYFRLASRRLYRLSYLPSTLQGELARDGDSRSQKILRLMRVEKGAHQSFDHEPYPHRRPGQPDLALGACPPVHPVPRPPAHPREARSLGPAFDGLALVPSSSRHRSSSSAPSN